MAPIGATLAGPLPRAYLSSAMANVDNIGVNTNREARIQREIAQSKDPHASVRVFERGSANKGIREGQPIAKVRPQPPYGHK